MPTITELIAETIHERAPIDDETAHTIAETITTHPKLTIHARNASTPTVMDLDAIQARADAATEGPWETRTGKYLTATSASIHSGPRSILVGRDGYSFGYADLADAEFIAHARTDIPALVSLVRELQAGIPTRTILDGDPDDIEKALDNLPESPRPVVTCESLMEPGVFIRVDVDKWYGAGNPKPFTSRYLARYCAPLTVLR